MSPVPVYAAQQRSPFATGRRRRTAVRVLTAFVLLTLLCVTSASASDQTELLYNRGVAAYGTGDDVAARRAFEAVVEQNPADADAHVYLGLIARKQGETENAIASLRRAAELDPDDVATQTVLTETLLLAGQNDAARTQARQALTMAPSDPHLLLYAGIAEYRTGDPRKAIGDLEEARRLDPGLERESLYYTGLAQIALGNLYASSAAFGDLAEDSPGHPLGNSARALREQMAPLTESRIWFVSATAGIEADTNPTAASKVIDSDADVLGSFRLRALVDAYRGGGFTLRAGYDGFLAGYANDSLVNEQTHVARALATYDYMNASFGVRYDYSITLLDFTEKFRGTHSIQPIVNLRTGDLGVTQAFYQIQLDDYFLPPVSPELDQNGNRQAVGLNQILMFDGLFSSARFGAAYLSRSTDGTEWDYRGLELNVGGGVLLPWRGMTFSTLYRYARLWYQNPSIFPEQIGTQPPAPGQGVRRHENVHNLSFDLNVPLWRQLSVALAANMNFRSSQIDVLEYDRHLFGAYFTWNF